jgi:urease accessory protein
MLSAPRPGTGSLVVRRRGAHAAGCIAAERRATSPLKLLAPRNHGRAAWVFAATLGGGLVDGDCIDLDVRVEPGAWALLGTQASTKVYRCPRSASRQSLVARVDRDAVLVSLPDAVVPYRDGRFEQRAEIRLESDASLLWVDPVACGRAAHGERWELGRYASRLRVERAGRTVVHDHVVLDREHGALGARLGRFEALATLVCLGPALGPVVASLAACRPALVRDAPLSVATSPLADDGVVVRMAATTLGALTDAVRGALAPLAPLLGDDPFARKW